MSHTRSGFCLINFSSKGVRQVKKKDIKLVSQILMGGAAVSVLLAGIGYLGTDIWLASTQWLLVGALLGLFGVYLKGN